MKYELNPNGFFFCLTVEVYERSTHHFGLEGRLYLPVLQALPVDASEEGVFSDVPLSLGAAAQTLGWVLGHQLLVGRNKKEDAELEQGESLLLL